MGDGTSCISLSGGEYYFRDLLDFRVKNRIEFKDLTRLKQQLKNDLFKIQMCNGYVDLHPGRDQKLIESVLIALGPGAQTGLYVGRGDRLVLRVKEDTFDLCSLRPDAGADEKTAKEKKVSCLQSGLLFSEKGTFKYSSISHIIYYRDHKVVFLIGNHPITEVVGEQAFLGFIFHQDEFSVNGGFITCNA